MSFILAALFLATIPAMAAPSQASDEDKREIMKIIADGMAARAEYAQWVSKEEKLRKTALAYPRDLIAQEAWKEAEENRKEQKQLMEKNLNGALDMTARAYHFKPFNATKKDGKIKSGPFKDDDKQIKWKAEYADNNAHFFKADGPDRPHYLSIRDNMEGSKLGLTLDNGATFIRLGAFEKAQLYDDPGILGSILYHETLHYRKLTTGSGWSTKEQEELSAYAEELRQVSVFGLDKLPPNEDGKTEIDKIKDARDSFQRTADKAKKDPTASIPAHTTSSAEESNKEGFEFVDKVNLITEQERNKVTGYLLTARREKAEQSRQELYLYQIGSIAKRLCDGASPVAQKEFDELPSIGDGMSFRRQHCDSPLADLDGSDCRESIFYSLCLATDPSKRPGVDSLRDAAQDYNRKRYLSMSNQLARRACTDYNSVTQAQLDGLPRFKPDTWFYMRCGDGLADPDGPSCEDGLSEALCESAGDTLSLSVALVRSKVTELNRPKMDLPLLTPKGASFQLAAVAGKACSSAGPVTNADLEPLYRWFPEHKLDSDESAAAGNGLDGCSRSLYATLLGLANKWISGKIDPDWINAVAAQARGREQPSYSPPADVDRGGRERPYSGPCGNGGSCCRWKRGC